MYVYNCEYLNECLFFLNYINGIWGIKNKNIYKCINVELSKEEYRN